MRMFDAFAIMRQLHELAWYLTEALALPAARAVHPELRAALEGIKELTRETADALLAVDLAGRRQAIGVLLGRASELVRAGVVPGTKRRGARDRSGADLAGADLRGQGPAGRQPARGGAHRGRPQAAPTCGWRILRARTCAERISQAPTCAGHCS